ncbi:MAG: hypothetical protein KA765_16225 [Thermoflexales bacterium]|nr:hypothetical protein [Thermoflexales bacterium]
MEYFIPSDHAPALRVLPGAFPPLPLAVVRAVIERHTQPGDVIVDPFCIGTSVLEGALDLNRKIVAASFNPINLLAIEATLWPSDARAALTHLADARKRAQRLREHVLDLYATHCPTCRRPAVALRFEWDRDRNIPIAKHVNCATCGENIGPTDGADIEQATRFKPRSLPFWTLHSRIVDPKHEHAERVGEVLDAYTPRAQNALGDIVLKFESLSEADRVALRPALLAALDAATSLHAPNDTHRVIGLKPSPRFIEVNVWLELEQQASLLRSVSPSLRRAATITELLASPEPAACVLNLSARDLAKQLPPRSVAALIAHPPQPRPGFWSLSAAWTAWLWGKAATEGLLPLLSRKRTNWDWQWRAIASGWQALNSALQPKARSVLAFAYDDAMLESVVLAGGQAQQQLEHLVCDPFDGVRATWRIAPWRTSPSDQPTVPDEAPIRLAARRQRREAAARVLRERAEPTAWSILQAGLYAALGRSDALSNIAQLPASEHVLRESIQDGLDQCVELADQHWWQSDLPHPPAPSPKNERTISGEGERPLADRVELAVRDLLRSRARWHGDDLLRAVYARFPDQLTPDRGLIATAIQSYAVEAAPHEFGLRPEDAVEARHAEWMEIETLLLTSGARLGFDAELRSQERGVIWQQADHVVYAFTLSTTAEVAPLLRASSGVLVLPGGRATLLQYKLAHDPRLHQTAWRVLKFSSLRHVAQSSALTPATFQLAFGLKPSIEQPAIQFQLWQ